MIDSKRRSDDEVMASRWKLIVIPALLCLATMTSEAQNSTGAARKAPAINASAPVAKITNPRELSSLDIWIVQRYRGAQLLPDSGIRASSPVRQAAGAPRVESARTTGRRDTIVALHFEPTYWRASLGTAAPVQLADPTGAISSVTGRITARRAFRAPRVAGARDTVAGDWRVGWAYLVAIPPRSANAAASGFNGWALVEAAAKSAAKPAQPDVGN